MRARPVDLSDVELCEALSLHWGISAVRVEYVAVGGGSYHWLVSDQRGRRWWVTVDDLSAKAFLGRDAERAFDGLRRALSCAVDLRQSGLDFVVAPVQGLPGSCLARLNARYAVAVYPWIDGTSFSFFDPLGSVELEQLALMLARLHASRCSEAMVAPLRPAELDSLNDALSSLDEAWTGGPYAEPVRQLLSERSDQLLEWLARFERLQAEVQTAAPSLVLTHGEPHPANLLRATNGRLSLLDWDTLALAPAERDIWWLSEPARTHYSKLSDHPILPAAIELYRLRWRLDDISLFVKLLRAPHLRTADTEHAWQALAKSLPGASDNAQCNSGERDG